MTGSTRGSEVSVLSLGCLAFGWIAGGCAPADFSQAIAYHAGKTAVTDAAARHTTASPYYRFNTALLSDLDEALEQSDESVLRTRAAAILREANVLSRASTANEIERMPVDARRELAALAKVEADIIVLRRHFAERADAALENDLRGVDRLSRQELREKLTTIRDGIEDLPDDKGRMGRQVLLLWAALPTAIGIAQEESHLLEKTVAKANKKFDRIAVWRPIDDGQDTLMSRYAPVIALEWPEVRTYDAGQDRIGTVKLSVDGGTIKVRIDPAEPAVYAYTSQAKIGGRIQQQLNYVWWFPERPEMTTDDPVAGHIDGAMLRITLDANDVPVIIESSLNCGCAHEVFVSDNLESAAREAFGSPLVGKRFAVEKHVPGKHDVIVTDTFYPGPSASRPLVLSSAGYHEVCRIRFSTPESIDSLEIVEEASYRILNYDMLDRLPLGDGIASMFGPDGLVHNAGRPEGLLLSPSGILSAGQPRKRGTQRIRWDDFLHDDPHLLENTLRIPPHD